MSAPTPPRVNPRRPSVSSQSPTIAQQPTEERKQTVEDVLGQLAKLRTHDIPSYSMRSPKTPMLTGSARWKTGSRTPKMRTPKLRTNTVALRLKRRREEVVARSSAGSDWDQSAKMKELEMLQNDNRQQEAARRRLAAKSASDHRVVPQATAVKSPSAGRTGFVRTKTVPTQPAASRDYPSKPKVASPPRRVSSGEAPVAARAAVKQPPRPAWSSTWKR